MTPFGTADGAALERVLHDNAKLARAVLWRRLPWMCVYALASLGAAGVAVAMIVLPHQWTSAMYQLAFVVAGALAGSLGAFRAEWGRVRRLGAWGGGTFENPEAMAWLDTLETEGVSALRRAFAATEWERFLGLTAERRALAAAEIVVALATGPSWSGTGPHLPSKALAWLVRHDVVEIAGMVTAAEEAVTRADVNRAGMRGPDPKLARSTYRLMTGLERIRANRVQPGNGWATAARTVAARQISAMNDRALWALVWLFAISLLAFMVSLALTMGVRATWVGVVAIVSLGSLIPMPTLFGLLCAWRFWTTRWIGNGPGTRPPGVFVTRRSLPVIFLGGAVVWTVFWGGIILYWTLGAAAALDFDAIPVATLTAAGVFALAAVSLETVSRPRWALPSDLRIVHSERNRG